jgi:tetratricopeptide (TPR) repeat protein
MIRRLALLFVALSANPALVVAADNTPRIAKALTEAQESASKGELDRALERVNEAIRADPMRAQAYTLRGWLWMKRGDMEKACTDLSQAIRLDPNSSEAYAERARVYLAKSLLEEALADCNASIALNPKEYRTFLDRGIIWCAKKEQKKALLDLDTAIRLRPTSAEAFRVRGWIQYDLDCTSNGAFSDFDKAVQLDPTLGGGYLGRGLSWMQKGELDKALPDLLYFP